MTANDVGSGFRRAGQIAVVSAEVQQVAWLPADTVEIVLADRPRSVLRAVGEAQWLGVDDARQLREELEMLVRLESQIAGAAFALELATDAERGGTGVLVVPGSRTP